MKLRNKKTDDDYEMRDSSGAGIVIDIGEHGISVYLYDYEPGDEEISGEPSCRLLGVYNSLAEFNEEWEDYEPKEPLIKDEKVRKAVRAWAEANEYSYEDNFEFNDFGTSWHSWSLEHKSNGDYNEIHFNGGIDFEKMTHQGLYTFAELCGEEE